MTMNENAEEITRMEAREIRLIDRSLVTKEFKKIETIKTGN